MQLLVEGGVPAVVAMLDKIAVDDARTFNQGFYTCLLEDGRADEAVNRGRQLLVDRPGDAWATPAVTTRLKNGSAWTESALRRAGRLLHARMLEDHTDQFPDFPIDVLPVSSSQQNVTTTLTTAPSQAVGCREDINRLLASRLDEMAKIDALSPQDLAKADASVREKGRKSDALICLVGDTGSAKTTVLETTFLREAPRHWAGDQPAIPVMLRLQDCVFSNLNATTTLAAAVARYFETRAGFAPDPDSIAQRFNKRTFLFLISGDEEFTEGTLADALVLLKEFREVARVKHHYVVTLDQNSLDIGSLPEGSECLVVQPMSAERVGEYLRNIPPGANPAMAHAGAGLFSRLKENGLFDLTEIPWLLGEMLNHELRGVSQTSRSAILKRITDERICRAEGAVGTRQRVEEALFRIAWEIQTNHLTPGSQRRRHPGLYGPELFGLLSELRGNRDFSLSDFRNQLISRCKILTAIEQDGVRFAYPGFRAYCCARYIQSQPAMVQEQILEDITATLGRRSRVERWGETLTVLAGLQCNVPDILKLLRMILSGSPLNEGEQVFVAARCLQEFKLTLCDKGALNTLTENPVVRSVVSSLIYWSHPSSDASVEERKRALRSLGPLKAPAAVPHLVALVAKKVRLGKDGVKQYDLSGIRMAAIKALIYTPAAVIKEIESDAALSANQELHRVLGLWLELKASDLLQRVSCPDTLVASIAAFAAGLMKPAGALDKLRSRFKTADADVDLLWAIADSMLELGDPELPGVVRASMGDRGLWEYTAYLMGKIGAAHLTDDFHGFLRKHLDDDSPGTEKLRGQCLQALAEAGDEEVLEHCYRWLDGNDPTLRYYALQGIRHVGDTQSLLKLEELQWDRFNSPFLERLRLDAYEDLYWRLAGGLSREVMAPM
jgi:hypothetical protein